MVILIAISLFILNFAIFLDIPGYVSRKNVDESVITEQKIITENLKQASEEGLPAVLLGETTFKVEIVDTQDKRTLGLSGRESLPDDSGMLFVFENSYFHGFWMKDMNFPIDIIWLDENLKVVHIEKNVQPESFPEVYLPDKPALYVLEINAGEAEKNSIKVGSEIVFI